MHEPGTRTRVQILWRMLAVVFAIVVLVAVSVLIPLHFFAKAADEADGFLGPHLSTEARAEIDRADCPALHDLAWRYSPNADSVRDAGEARDRIVARAKKLGCPVD